VLKQYIPTAVIDFNGADVAIDFSIPEAAFINISEALKKGIPVVSGTTGWLDRYDEILALCKEKNGSFLYASNFSLGVNLFFELNTKLAELMQNFNYDVSITETHHTQKLDAPSGTAISLAEQILPFSSNKNWVLDTNNKNNITISAKREKDVPGTHQVFYKSTIDEIEIKHTAKNRMGFAQGAVLAAVYIAYKKGVFSMKDVLFK
jgi:4-hydroxy-tetrahydrodipicolinate reductase